MDGRTQHPIGREGYDGPVAGVRLPAPATMPATVHGDHCTSASYAPAESTEDRPLVVLDGTWSQQATIAPLFHPSTTSPHALIDVCGRFNMVGDTSRPAHGGGCCSFEIDVPDDLCAMGSVCIGRRRT